MISSHHTTMTCAYTLVYTSSNDMHAQMPCTKSDVVWDLIEEAFAMIIDYLITILRTERVFISCLVTTYIIFGRVLRIFHTSQTTHTQNPPPPTSPKNPHVHPHCSDRSNVGAGGVTSTIAGPYKILLSARDVLVEAFVRKTYV